MKRIIFFLVLLFGAVDGYCTIHGNTSTAPGTSETYTVDPMPGAKSYTWTLTGGLTGSSTTNSITVSIVGCTGGTISVYGTNGCDGNGTTESATITVSAPLGSAGAITGSTNVCPSTSQAYSIASVSGAISYLWELPFGWTGSSSSNSINVNVPFGGTIKVRPVGGCGQGAQVSLSVSSISDPTYFRIDYRVHETVPRYIDLEVANEPPNCTYQWYSCDSTYTTCSPISGANTKTYRSFCDGWFKPIITNECGVSLTLPLLYVGRDAIPNCPY